MSRKKVLFICGSINQTTQMHAIAQRLPEYAHVYSPYYGNFDYRVVKWLGFLEGTIGGNKLRARCLDWLHAHELAIDDGGKAEDIDLVFQCSDLLRPKNLRGRRVVLVQEGMTDPENLGFRLVQRFRWLDGFWGGTAATGLSDQYDKFCVASEGYRDLFVRRGVKAEKVVVTGIPNFDDAARFRDNEFPLQDFVLVCTSDVREVYGFEDRPAFIRKARDLAAGRPLVFKLHPNEDVARATREIREHAPEAQVFASGNAEHMVANCCALVTQYSSLAHVGVALGKEVHSFFDREELRRLTPIQNGGTSARAIADVARALLGDARAEAAPPPSRSRSAAAQVSA